MPQDSFAERLREARSLRGLSQQELAEKTGLQTSAISHFETGKRSPSFMNLRRLAEALDVTTDFLLGRQAHPTSAGPQIQQLFRDVDRMTDEDMSVLLQMASALANRDEGKKK